MPRIRLRDGLGDVRLKYLCEDTDRHGNVRLYVRKPGHKKIRLREALGTRAFLDEYWAALNNEEKVQPKQISKHAATDRGSLRWLCIQYYKSAPFGELAERTRKVRRGILERICQKDGDKPYAMMEPRHVRQRRDQNADRPEAANAMVKALRQLYGFAIEYDLAQRNPAKDVPYLKSHSDGFHSWSMDEVSRFEERHPVGSKARLALALLLYTGQRRSDIVRLGPQHVKEGWLSFTQAKNRARKPVSLSIPVLPELQAIIDQTSTGDLAFLTTEFGKPFTSNGFGNWFRKRCDEAGLPNCTAHGLRKAGAALAAENGATERQLMAIFGWSTMKEASRYTKAARQKVLAGSGMKHLTRKS
ncbi:tyrosine-type recombinase/integrase [Pseudooceanicola sp.]|uniref:tyrosine-type recombinase/integrase n=1 Tax=Pseudooceanicola sp. TaxID=1914328 RepID=UPI003516BBCC